MEALRKELWEGTQSSVYYSVISPIYPRPLTIWEDILHPIKDSVLFPVRAAISNSINEDITQNK